MKDVRIVKTFVMKLLENTGSKLYELKLPTNQIVFLNVKLKGHRILIDILKNIHQYGDGYRLIIDDDFDAHPKDSIMSYIKDFNYRIKVKIK